MAIEGRAQAVWEGHRVRGNGRVRGAVAAAGLDIRARASLEA